jgi:SAM-dependent methyltransferase
LNWSSDCVAGSEPRQHLDTFRRRLHGFGLSIDPLIRGARSNAGKAVLRAHEQGEVHILIATHAALAARFHDLGLVIIDEEQRFGEAQKQKLRRLQAGSHSLVMTARPLPRTDLRNWTVLDIGCNAGFYSFELARRGAKVLGIDANPYYLAQARWAAAILGLSDTCRFECRHHLRYPLLGLDIVAEKVRWYLVFQSAATGEAGRSAVPADVDFQTMDELERRSWPRMAFIESTFAMTPPTGGFPIVPLSQECCAQPE